MSYESAYDKKARLIFYTLILICFGLIGVQIYIFVRQSNPHLRIKEEIRYYQRNKTPPAYCDSVCALNKRI